jgi:putative drug exporter of the RND superfamily
VSVLEAVRGPQPPELAAAREVGPLGRLGHWTVDHVRTVALAWLVAAVALGALAPRAEHALSGAGWESSGSESVQARRLVQERFGGLSSQAFMIVVHSATQSTGDPAFRQVLASVTARLRASDAVASVVPPRPGATVSRDGHTAIVTQAQRERRPRRWPRLTS